MVVGVLGVVTSCVLCARVSRVLRDVKTTGRLSCATENTHIVCGFYRELADQSGTCAAARPFQDERLNTSCC